MIIDNLLVKFSLIPMTDDGDINFILFGDVKLNYLTSFVKEFLFSVFLFPLVERNGAKRKI